MKDYFKCRRDHKRYILINENSEYVRKFSGNFPGMDKELEIRRATAEDKEEVLKIHDHVYDGHDYLPAYYDHFLSSTDFNPFVLILDGKIVSLTFVFMV